MMENDMEIIIKLSTGKVNKDFMTNGYIEERN
jgi:hypothetical protein